MRSLMRLFPLLVTVLLFFSCAEENPSNPTDEPPITSGPDTVTVLYTNDEHGWMERVDDIGGAAEMVALWKDELNFDPDGSFLVLSGGDMWTGAAISTWFNGRSMVQVMNAMGYDAAALGNHEYDFGPDTLAARAEQMDFPILAANLTEDATGTYPEYVQPYTLVIEAGHTIGIVGIANRYTYELNFEENVAGLTFGDYEDAVREAVPDAYDAGAEVVVVIAHISGNEMRALAPVVADVNGILLGGGHTNEYINEINSNVALVMANTAYKYYAATKFIFREDNTVGVMTPWLTSNDQAGVDAEIASVIAPWQTQLDTELGVVIGYASTTISRQSHLQTNMILDSWVQGPWGATIAIGNTGGFRADIPAGDVTRATVVGVLPFENDLVRVTMSGAEIVGLLQGYGGSVRMGGMTRVGSPAPRRHPHREWLEL